MALDSPYYFAIGSLVVEDGTGSGPYHPVGIWLPAPAPDGAGGHLPAVRRFRVKVTGTSTATLTANTAALQQACVRDETLYFRASGSGDIFSCRIREASVVEDEVDLLGALSFERYVTLTLTTDPYWLAPWSSETTVTLTAVPGTFTIADPGGEVDALVSMRAVASATARGLFLGAMPDAASGFDPIDDYGASGAGTSDANALTGYKVASSALTATMAAVGTAPAFDTNANRGTYIPIVRMDSNAASVATTAYRVVQRVTGNAIAASTDVPTASVTPRDVALVATELERISVPSGAVPDITTDSGWTDPVITDQQTAVNANYSGGAADNVIRYIGQTVSLTAGEKVTRFVFKTSSANSYPGGQLSIVAVDGNDLPVTTGAYYTSVVVPAAPMNTAVNIDLDWVVPETANYAFLVSSLNYVRAQCYTPNGYASGQMVRGNSGYYVGASTAEAVTGYDLYFQVYCATHLGFNSYSIVQASDTADASKIANLDYLVRIPVDYAALAYRLSTSAAPALYYDGDTDVAYIADADGIGPAVLDKAEVIKPLRAKPGVSTTYVLATTHDDVAVGTASVTYKTRARYLSATG